MKASSTPLFIDRLEIKVSSGKGGAGCSSFRREAKVPRGGPDGGDGGRGGNVYIVGDSRKHTLLDYKYKTKYEARNGQPGMGARCYGKAGDHAKLFVPLGTQIRIKETNELLLDVVKEDEYKILEGGKGGLGNWHFRSSRQQAPEYSQTGLPGESLDLILELKLLADVGIVGFPNAGKSTLISVLSKARPKVASYPFTTLNPQLGVMEHKNVELVIADLPGLIEGASEGVGLGHRFLRHAERTSEVLHVVSLDPTEELSAFERYKLIRKELQVYSEKHGLEAEGATLQSRREIIVLSKSDLCTQQQKVMELELFRKEGLKCFVVSSMTHENIEALKDTLILKGSD